jgi:hypothetical protein
MCHDLNVNIAIMMFFFTVRIERDLARSEIEVIDLENLNSGSNSVMPGKETKWSPPRVSTKFEDFTEVGQTCNCMHAIKLSILEPSY